MANQITAIIPTWKRPENVGRVIESIRKQTIPALVYVIDNGAKTDKPFRGSADQVFSLSSNWGCWARFPICAFVRTPYVWQMDDDLVLTEPDVFERYVHLSHDLGDLYVIGAGGKVLYPGEKAYQASRDSGPGLAVMVNTGFTLFPTALMNRIPMNPLFSDKPIDDDMLHNADDPWICSYLDCYVAPWGWYGIERLSECDLGVSHDIHHMDKRNAVCTKHLTGKRLGMEERGDIKKWQR